MAVLLLVMDIWRQARVLPDLVLLSEPILVSLETVYGSDEEGELLDVETVLYNNIFL